jgi:hypothetical protein
VYAAKIAAARPTRKGVAGGRAAKPPPKAQAPAGE